jgi:hypothetical protein
MTWSTFVTTKMRSKSPRPASFLRVAYSAPARDALGAAEIRRFTLPATKALPFVMLKANDQPMWRPESYWRVQTTGRRKRDAQIGREYAREAIAAMKADRNSDLIALIIQDIIGHAVEEAATDGRRIQSPIVQGFLAEISKSLAAPP